MSLQLYHSKRDFKKTAEPRGKKQAHKGPLKFYIQKHAARRLHYDLRLELDGVLKSWAVPKGPSFNPKDRRLAIQVEDHPLDYGSFEGVIPASQYGAGTVEVWDQGTYSVEGKVGKREQENAIRRQLEKGELKLSFHGTKMHGKFVLVRLATDPTGKNWLLIKKHDEEEKKLPILKTSLKKQFKQAMPHMIKPMLAYLADEPFDHPKWLYEVKWDGYRAIAEVTGKEILLYSRNFISFKEKFPKIVKSLEKFKDKIILDGEIVMLDSEGKSKFQDLQNYLNEDPFKGFIKYCVFDLLYYKNRDLRSFPLIERKELLKQLIEQVASPDIIYSDHIVGQGTTFFKALRHRKVEGMLAKELNSPYLSSRSKHWLKIKVHERQEVIIAGFTSPKGSRKQFGALVLGIYDNNELKFAGQVGTGFNQASLKQVYKAMEPLITESSPFKKRPSTTSKPIWVKPELVCEVSFQEWTKDEIMRQPVFEGLRPDKSAKMVGREKPIAIKNSLSVEKKLENHFKSIKKRNNFIEEIITHPDKLLWPKEGITKRDLLEYYNAIASFLLPHIKDRPITMHRYPDGVMGADFYQKEAPEFLPHWVHTAVVEQSKKNVKYILVKDIKEVLYIANLGSIELHPFLSRYPEVDFPDYLVLDIDPVDFPFEATVEVVRKAHSILDTLQVDHYCKTSGKRGIHLFIPLHAKYPYETVENLAKLLAYYLHQKMPDLTSVVRDPAKRQKKVYLDFLQNGRTKTVVAPYSVRPVEGATVSAPLDWKELRKGLDPKNFTIKNMPDRLKKKGDLFKGVLGKRIDVKALLRKIEI